MPRDDEQDEEHDEGGSSKRKHHDDDAADQEGGDEGGGKKKKSKKDKVKLMADSGQTTAERREIRADQRKDKEDFVAQRAEIGKLDSDAYEKANRQNNKTFERVRFTREMVGDGENLKLIASAASKQVEDLMTGGSLFDAQHIIQKLRERGGVDAGKDFNWRSFGHRIGVLMRTVPRMTFMNGTIERPEKVVKAKPPRAKKPVDTDAPEVRPDVVKPGSKDKDEKDATEKRIEVLHTVIQKLHKKHGDDATFNFAEFLINPQSFTQTVENIFDFSFDIKEGLAELSRDTATGALKLQRREALMDEKTSAKNNQTVLSFNLQDYYDMIELYNLEGKAPVIPARTGADYFDPLEKQPDVPDDDAAAAADDSDSGVEESKGGEPEDDDDVEEEAVEPAPTSRGKKRASKK